MAFATNTQYLPAERIAGTCWPSNFNGTWEDSRGTPLAIVDTYEQKDELHTASLHMPDGQKLDLTINKGTCLVGGATPDEASQVGKLYAVASRIKWNDGSFWFRTSADVEAILARHAEDREDKAKEDTRREEAFAEEVAAKEAEVKLPTEKVPDITLADALSLQRELFAGFSEPKLNDKLRALRQLHGGTSESFSAERSQLYLAVQKKVLPKYGFEGSHAGMLEMLDACAPHNEKAEYRRNRIRLNGMLGLPVDEGIGGDEGSAIRIQAELVRAKAADVASVVAQAANAQASREEEQVVQEDNMIQVLMCPFPDGATFTIELPGNSTFYDLRRVLSARDSSMTQATLVGRGRNCHATYQDHNQIGDVREVSVVVSIGQGKQASAMESSSPQFVN